MTRLQADLQGVQAKLQDEVPSDDVLAGVRTTLKAIDKSIAGIGQKDDAFASDLGERITHLRSAFGGTIGQSGPVHRIKNRIPALFSLITSPKPPQAATPERYHGLDTDVTKLETILAYARIHADKSSEGQKRLDDCNANFYWPGRSVEQILVKYLEEQNLRGAQLLVRQARQLIFAGDLQSKLPQLEFSIRTSPMVARENEPVKLAAVFEDGQYNHSAARERLRCVWDFNHDGLKEDGWEVSHYFPSSDTYDVAVSFRDMRGKEITDTNNAVYRHLEKIKVRPAEGLWRLGERTRAELTRLVIALLAAVFAMVLGAREEVLKLDFVPGMLAVFALGFGADTIKNLISRGADEGT